MKDRGIRLIDEKLWEGAAGAGIAFLHPESTFGIFDEPCERQRVGCFRPPERTIAADV